MSPDALAPKGAPYGTLLDRDERAVPATWTESNIRRPDGCPRTLWHVPHTASALLLALVLAALVVLGSVSVCSAAPEAASTPPSRADAEAILDTLKDPDKRERFTATLEAYVRSLPLQSAAAPAGTKKSAETAVPRTAAGVSSPARALTYVSQHVQTAGARLVLDFRALTDFPALTIWLRAKLANDSDRAGALEAGVFALIILAAMGLGELLLRWLGHRAALARSARARREAASGSRVWLTLRRAGRAVAIPVGIALIGNAMIVVLLGGYPVARAVTFGIVNVYIVVRLVLALFAVDFSGNATRAEADGDRRIGSATKLIVALLVALVGLAIIGRDVIAELGASDTVQDAFQKSVALVIHCLLILWVITTRGTVAAWIRRQAGTNRTMSMFCDTLAAIWPYVAVTAIASGWLVWAMDIPDAYHRLVHFVVATAAVLIVCRVTATLLIQSLDQRLAGLSTAPKNSLGYRLGGYRRLGRGTLRIAILVATAIALTEVWGLESLAWFRADHPGHQALVLILKLGVLGLLGILAWEFADFAFEARVTRLTESESLARATRLRTLQPIIRVALIVTLGLMILVTALNEIGINVGPLLAGASIFGVALGFGSQKLVQDFITGIFLLVENAVDVGDSVTVAGLSGSVEHLSIRTIRLRAGDGSVHLIPFSSVTSVTNTNRGVGNAAVAVCVDAAEDTDRVAAILQAIVLDMRAEPAFGPLMLSDLDLWGVDKVEGAMTTIAGQIVCTDAGRWPVQREFNRRFKKRFEQEGIALGIPHQHLEIVGAVRERQQPRASLSAS